MMRRIVHVLPVIACMSACAFFAYFPLTDSDIFWHLAAGRDMLAHKHFLYTDPFAFTLNAPRWVDVHWLFQLMVYGIYSLGAAQALVIFKLCVAATAGFLCAAAPAGKRASVATCILVSLVMYVVRYLIDVRPVLITMMCMAFYVLLFERTRTALSKRWLLLCIPLQLLWANSQGLYMLGLFIIGVYWLEAVWNSVVQKKDMSVVLVASVAACVVTPYGISGLMLPFTLLGRIQPTVNNLYSMNIAENVPLFMLTGYECLYTWFVVLSAAITCVLFIVNRKTVRVAHVLLFAGFLWLAISAVRNVLLYAIIDIPVLLHLFASVQIPFLHSKKVVAGAYITGSIVLAAALLQHSSVVSLYPRTTTMLSPFRFPTNAVEYMEQHPLQGRVFNDIRSGGYLLWRMYPQQQVFIDGRLVIRSPQFFVDYLAVCSHPELYFTGIATKFSITRIVLPFAVFPLYHPLIKWLYESKDWKLVYTDGAYVVFDRCVAGDAREKIFATDNAVDSIANAIRCYWADAPVPVQKEAQQYFIDMLDFLRVSR